MRNAVDIRKSESFSGLSSIVKNLNSVAMKFSPMKVINSSLMTDSPTNPLMKEMEHEHDYMMDRLVEEESAYMMDRLVEVPYLFFCILALSVFLIIGFVLHICWKAETSSGWRVQEWFCNGTSRQHRWRALHTLHRECMHEELFQREAAKMDGETENKNMTKEEEGRKSLLVRPDKPCVVNSYGAIDKLDHV